MARDLEELCSSLVNLGSELDRAMRRSAFLKQLFESGETKASVKVEIVDDDGNAFHFEADADTDCKALARSAISKEANSVSLKIVAILEEIQSCVAEATVVVAPIKQQLLSATADVSRA